MFYEGIIELIGIQKWLDAQWATIQSKLLSAGGIIMDAQRRDKETADPASRFQEQTDLMGVSECLQLSSTAVLLGSNSQNMDEALWRVQREEAFSGQDPHTVIVSAVLYHLVMTLREDSLLSPRDKEAVEHIYDRFQDLNWMLNEQSVCALTGVGQPGPPAIPDGRVATSPLPVNLPDSAVTEA